MSEPVFEPEDEIERAAAREGMMMGRGFRSSRGLNVIGTVYRTAGIGRNNAKGRTEKPVIDKRAQRKAERKARIAAIKARMSE